MKKLLILAVALSTVCTAVGQSKEVEAVKKRLEKSDAAIADPKKAAVAATWIDRAKIYTDVANVYTSKFIQGFSLDQVGSLVGTPTSADEVEFKGAKFKENKYEQVTIYTDPEENTIVFWTVNKDLIDQPLNKSLESLIKAKELSPKDFVGQGKGVIEAGRLQAIFQTDGMSLYTMNKPAEASVLFGKSFEVGELTGQFDTLYLYYAGVTSFEAQKYDEAIKVLDKVLATGNDQVGMVYYYIGEAYTQKGEAVKGIEVLEKGFDKYPENATILGTLINSYLTAKQDPAKVIAKVQQAQKLDSTNTSLYLVESSIYNEIGDKAKAYGVLQKAIQIDPKFFDAYYNYAIMKILEAQDLREQAEKLDLNDNANYEKLMNQIIELQTQAIEKLEFAHEVDKSHASTIDILKQLYYGRRDEAKASERYEYFEKLFNETK